MEGDKNQPNVENSTNEVLANEIKHLKSRLDEAKKTFEESYLKSKSELDKLENERARVCAVRGEVLGEIKLKMARISDLVLSQANRLNEVSNALAEVDQDVDGMDRKVNDLFRSMEKINESNNNRDGIIEKINKKTQLSEDFFSFLKQMGKLMSITAAIVTPILIVLANIRDIWDFFKSLFGY